MSLIDFASDALILEFSSCLDQEEIYRKIIAWGEKLPPFDPAWKTPENLVHGCQSVTYLHSSEEEGKFFFAASSDALISSGLAAVLLSLYNDKTPQEILSTPPAILQKLGIVEKLSPGRANGFAALYLRIREIASAASNRNDKTQFTE